MEFNKFDIEGKSFLHLLWEIEKEGIVDIDTWDELRILRNNIAHEYPREEKEALEATKLLIEKSSILIAITKTLQERFYEIR